MLFVVLLVASFRFIPNQCYKFPKIGKPFPELVEFLELLSFDIATDVFLEFSFVDPSLYAAYSKTQLSFAKQHSGIIALRFNMDVLPLRAYSEHIFHTDSLDALM